jgi:hypothetical protein
MNSIAAIEVPIEFAVATVEPLGPFRWVLLHALRTFPSGGRPEFPTLAEKLCLGERAFLDVAWTSLITVGAVDRDVFADATITVRGEEMLASDCVLSGAPETRTALFHFAADDGREVEIAESALTDLRALRSPPAWRDQLTSATLAATLVRQSPKLAPQPDERILRFTPDWSAAREVRLTPRAAR